MAFDFPSSPSEGQAYSPSGGPRYVYKSGVWKADLPYSPFEFQRNRVINPAFQVSQENGRASVTATAQYPADQWRMDFASSGGAPQTASAEGAPNYLRVWSGGVADATIGATDHLTVQHPMEGYAVADLGWGAAGAVPLILSFKARVTAAGMLPFTFSVAIRNGTGTRNYIKNFTITAAANTWQSFSMVVPGDVTGTWVKDNTCGMILSFAAMCGTTYQGAQTTWQAGNLFAASGISNLMAAISQGLDIAEVGLYADFSGNGVAPRFEEPSHVEQLDLCQRYFELGQGRFAGTVTTGVNHVVQTTFRTVKRVAPTMSLTNLAATGFPATASSVLENTARGFAAQRTANTTGAAVFVDSWEASARM